MTDEPPRHGTGEHASDEHGRPAYRRLKPGPGHSPEEVAADQRARILGAMVELVAERGYDAVAVSDLARRARVSTKTFYELSRGKQNCLLEAHDEITERAARRIEAGQTGEVDWRRRSRLALTALAAVIVENPDAARLACLEASAAGLGALERMRDAKATFEAVVADCLATDPEGPSVGPAVATGIVMGLMQVVRARLIAGREDELPGLVEELFEWASALCAPGVRDLETLGCAAGDPAAAACALRPAAALDASTDPTTRERALILAATIELAARDGYWQLSVPRIRQAAGISRRRFEAHFDSVEGCFVAALELEAARVVGFVRHQSRLRGRDWPRGFHRAVASLCANASSDTDPARLALIEVLASGPAALRHHTRLTCVTAEHLRAGPPPAQRPSLPIAEAAMGAIWGMVRDHIVSPTPACLRNAAPLLSFVALQPSIGTRAALDAIEAEEARYRA